MTTVGVSLNLLREQTPVIDYTSLDFDTVFDDLTVFAQTRFSDRWTNFNPNEFAVVWLNILSYIHDMLAYNQNAQLGERDVMACTRRQNFINNARSYDARLRGPQPARVSMDLTSNVGQLPYLLSATGLRVSDSAGEAIFMPEAPVLITTTPQSVDFIEGDLHSNELIGTGDGSPDQRFVLLNTPLLEDTETITVNSVAWERITNPIDAQSTDQVYWLDTDEDDNTYVVFGDGINGQRVPSGHAVRATYKTGGGKRSNLPARTITTIVSGAPGALISVVNPAKATGGDDRQTLKAGKAALRASLHAQMRAVVVADYASILFDTRLTNPAPPSGIAKAAAMAGGRNRILVSVAPSGGGQATATLKSEVSSFLRSYGMPGTELSINDYTVIPLDIELSAYISENAAADELVTQLRSLFVTEEPNAITQGGMIDFDNVGFGARDDEGDPQLTLTRVQNVLAGLRSKGLQKVVVERFTTVPQTKQPRLRVNAGNATITDVTVFAPVVSRREWVVRWLSAERFSVYQRIIGRSTFLTDTQLVDDRLDLDNLPDITLPFATTTVLNPNRNQSLTFAVDVANTTGQIIVKSAASAGSLFGVARRGDEYYLEIEDGLNNDAPGFSTPATASAVSYTSSLSGVSFTIEPGTIPHTPGDELLFDVFPIVGDIVLREDELPELTLDENGVATGLVITPRTSV